MLPLLLWEQLVVVLWCFWFTYLVYVTVGYMIINYLYDELLVVELERIEEMKMSVVSKQMQLLFSLVTFTMWTFDKRA